MDLIYEHLAAGLERGVAQREGPRIGAELKFPLVDRHGAAASLETVQALWQYLQGRGWAPLRDPMTGQVVAAAKPGERNDTVASCETGYCKPEFSLAHVANLFDLEQAIAQLREELRSFAKRHDVRFLCYGIQPITPPSKRLLMEKTRTSVWDKVFGSNRCIAEDEGDDVCLFTLNAASHVHVSVSRREAIPAVNVLNGFSGAQIALTAHSNIWKGRIDPEYKCVAEKLWDWWMPDARRVGVPEKPFEDLEDYARAIASLRPVYVKRGGMPIVLTSYNSFDEYYRSTEAAGLNLEGREVALRPEEPDIDLHCTCCWHNARLSRYCTVENRSNDQQPPGDLVCVSALTLGLVCALDECWEVVSSYRWEDLREARKAACRSALEGRAGDLSLVELAEKMVKLARRGLLSRGLGEEEFLKPLERRLRERRCPADQAVELFVGGGIRSLLAARAL